MLGRRASLPGGPGAPSYGRSMTSATSLQDLVDDAAFLSHEHQLHLGDLYGDDAWNADMATGTFTFTDTSDRVVECRLQFLGTAAPGPSSWMWAWHNVNGFPDLVLEAAERARGTGLPELSTAELPLDDDLPYRLALAAKALTGSWSHYSAPVGGGTRAWMLVEHPTFELPAPSVPRVVRTLSEGLLSVKVVDHRRAVAAYAEARGLQPEQGPDGSVVLSAPDGSVTVRFDERGRISGIEATARRAPEPEREPEPGPSDVRPDEPTPVGSAPSASALAAAADEPAPEPRRRSWFRRRG